MTAGSPLVFPVGRTLAGWHPHLTRWQPRLLWVGHLLLHHVEALAGLHKPARLEPVPHFVLQALALTPEGTLERVASRLHLGPAFVRQVLRDLETDQLITANGNGTWSLTSQGRHGVNQGQYSRTTAERRSFYFIDSEKPAHAPHFLNLRRPVTTTSAAVAEGWHFQAEFLDACVSQSAEWKQHHGFPLDVEVILGSGSNHKAFPAHGVEPLPAWQRVILDRPERLCVALVLAPAEKDSERLLGFVVQQEGWVLQAAEPAFILPADWRHALPELAEEPSLDAWRQAWRSWCQPRGLPVPEIDACIVERQDYHLRVHASHRFVERLRATRSDALKGDAWLLTGTGRLRAAARVEVIEAERDPAD
jgi:hypothetical protein